ASPVNCTMSTLRPCFSAKPPFATMNTKPASLLACTMPCFQVFSCWADAGAAAARSAAASAALRNVFMIDLRLQAESAARPSSSGLVLPHRRIHLDVAAAFLRLLAADREIVAFHRHARLPLQVLRPVTEIVAMPRRFRLERRQAEALPNRLGVLHELLLGKRHRRKSSLEPRVDQHPGGLAFLARAPRPTAPVPLGPAGLG